MPLLATLVDATPRVALEYWLLALGAAIAWGAVTAWSVWDLHRRHQRG